MDPPWRGTIAPEMGTEMSTRAFLFSSETKFLYGAGGCVEVWASSCNVVFGVSPRNCHISNASHQFWLKTGAISPLTFHSHKSNRK